MTRKPDKPYPDFPLYAHANGQWAKRIRGKIHYFGSWDDPEAAGKKYEHDREALYAGRKPIEGENGLTVYDGCEEFLAAKHSQLEAGEISERTYNEYHDTCEQFVRHVGLARTIASLVPADFNKFKEELAKTLGTIRLGNEIGRVRSIFNYLADDDVALIDRLPRYGPLFRRPSASAMRLARAQSGDRDFTSQQICKLLKKANSRMRAMILLGLNCGMGNTDIGRLTHSHLDLRTGWLKYPRPKTGVARRAKLWPETIAALKQLPQRKPAEESFADLVFLTQTGYPWAREDAVDSPISKEMTKLLNACQMKRKGLSFYSLRHTFQIVGEETGDIPAVRSIMGHAPLSRDASESYRKISDYRLCHVASYVRNWWKKAEKNAKQAS